MESNKTYNPTIQYLTDEMINIYSGGNVITNWRDTNQKLKGFTKVVQGGVLDGLIFGSFIEGQCNCGKVRRYGVECPQCGSICLEEAESWRRYGRIDLPFYYVNELRRDNFLDFIKANFTFDFRITEEFKDMVTGRGKDRSLVFDFCQFEYDDETGKIIVTDEITDRNLCSYEGLNMIIRDHFPHLALQFRQFINSSIIVVPLPVRAPKYAWNGKTRELKNHKITTIYKCILYAITDYYKFGMEKSNGMPECEFVMFKATLRRYVSKCMNDLSSLLRPSKENISRQLQAHRMNNSGRCTIVPAPDLKVDEVYVPRHLMYEACKQEFIEWLINDKGMTLNAANNTYILDPTSEETQKLFEEFVDTCNGGLGKHVIINRNPTLYELGMACCKVKLTDNYTMGIPLLLCAPFNGDFDGDSMSFYVLPNKLTSAIIDRMSPKNLIYYKKNMNPLYTPSHEMMMGLLISTKIIQNPDGLLEFTSYEEAYQHKKKNRDFKWQTLCIINGVKTTLARYKLSELFDTDLNEYLESEGVPNLNAGLVSRLYDKLAELGDRTDRIQKIQEFALTISTTSGATAPKLSELYANVDKNLLSQIKEIEDSDKFSDNEKDIKVRALYDDFVKRSQFQCDEDGNIIKDEDGNPLPALDENGKEIIPMEVRLQVSESSRAKISQLLSMVMPQLNVGTSKLATVGESSLITGMTSTDYVNHSIENRLIQDIKQSSVPNSGYTTRQLVDLGASYFYSDQYDERNPGIIIPLKSAAGRTRVDGTVISKEEADRAKKTDTVRVRSLLTCTLIDRSLVPKDCISNLHNWHEGDNVGISILSSMTEGLTQSGLSLKHGGHLFETDPRSCIEAPEDGTIQVLDSYLVFNGVSGKEYTYPKSSIFTLNYTPTGKYKKGEVIGVVYRLFTPSYKLDSVIKLIGAQPSSSMKTIINNKVLICDCYAFGPGKISYKRGKTGVTGIQIGEYYYQYNDNACYFLPEGTEVKFGDRFCTGMVDMNSMVAKLRDYEKVFYIFSKQFDELIPGMQSELKEVVYSIIMRKVEGSINYRRIQKTIRQDGTLYVNLAFGGARQVLSDIPSSGAQFLRDAFTSILFPTLFRLEL